MKAFCTYCSTRKDPSPKKLSAINRYKSQRIIAVYNASQRQKCKFIILSGKFGLLNPNDELPHYDHLLQLSEVAEHANKVAVQLEELGFSEIVFFFRSALQDKNVLNYIDCLEQACYKTNTRFELREYSGL